VTTAGRLAWPAGGDPRLRGVDRTLDRLSPFVAFLVATLSVLLRQPGVPKVNTIWAEDGLIFATCAYARPLVPDCLFEPYAGWLQTAPRVGAAAAALVPPSELSIALTVVSALITGLVAAAVAEAVRGATGSWLAGLVAGAAVALTWQAAREVNGNVTNLPWILFAGSMTVLVAWWVGAVASPLGLGVLGLTALSSPFAIALLALGVVGAVVRRTRWQWVIGVLSVTTVVQMAVIVTTPRQPPGREAFDLAVSVGRYVRDVLGIGAFGQIRLPPSWLVAVAVLAVGGLAVALLLLANRRRESLTRSPAWSALVVLGALIGGSFVLFIAIQLVQHKYDRRYGYIPSTLLCVGLMLGAAFVQRVVADRNGDQQRERTGLGHWAGRLIVPAAAILLAAGFARSYRIEARASEGPDYPASFRAAAAACGAGPASGELHVPVAPIEAGFWEVRIPCGRVSGSGP
jgi:MFS family permease